jgi:arabinose-5-phosphate isomerase
MSGHAATARQVLEAEAAAVSALAARLDDSFDRAVEIILQAPGKTITTGMGKSGMAARKLAATLSSTGVPSVFLHPAEALHGDLGLCSPGDPVILFSNSGSTDELLRLLPALRGLGAPLIAILGNHHGPLAAGVDVVLDASVEREADSHGIVPTSSFLAAVALGDALALALMRVRSFGPEDFGAFHPAGQLGRNLRLRVADAMHSGEEVPWVRPGDPLKTVVIAMTRLPLGAACVLSPDGTLAGLITDGDLRRALETHDDIRALRASDVMTARPITVPPDATLREALVLMEERPRQLSVLPVAGSAGEALGLLRLHDVYRAGLDRRP